MGFPILRKERLTKRGCKLCNTGAFAQYPEYVKHIDSEAHKIRKEELQRVQRFLEDSDLDDVTSSPSLSDETPSVDGHRHSTVDSSEDFHSTSSVSLDYACNDSLEEADSESLKENFRSGALITSPGGEAQNHGTQSGKRRASWDTEDGFSHQREAKSCRLTHRHSDTPKQPCNQLTNNLSDELISDDGREYIAPTQAFFCQLCEQFFLTETGAKEKHCRTYQHQQRYKAKIKSLLEKNSAIGSSSAHVKSGLRTNGQHKASHRSEKSVCQPDPALASSSRSLSAVDGNSPAVRMEIILKNGALYLQPQASCREASTCSSGCNGNYFYRTDQSTDVPLLSSPIMS